MRDSSEIKWPLDLALAALRFLGAGIDQQIGYLPARITVRSLDGEGGVVETGNPLILALHLCRRACAAGVVWDEWDERAAPDAERDQLFRELHGIVVALTMVVEEHDTLASLRTCAASPHLELFASARRYAKEIACRLNEVAIAQDAVIPLETLLQGVPAAVGGARC